MKRDVLIRCALGVVIGAALIAAAQSQLLAWREPIYIGAGFAGIFAMVLLLLQPVLARNWAGLKNVTQARRCHQWVGGLIVAGVLLHVLGLWITSLPDVIDALAFKSPTPFSAWGVVAMWALFLATLLFALKRRLSWSPGRWRLVHQGLVIIVVAGSVVHALLIEGTMEEVTKVVLCSAVSVALAWALWRG